MNDRKTRAKKTEIIEVRVDPDTKQALQDRAQSDGRTVSAIVRELIQGFLTSGEEVVRHRGNRFKPIFAVIAGFAMLTAALLGTSRLANAEETTFKLSASLSRTDGEIINSRTIDTTLKLSEGHQQELFLPAHGDQSPITVLVSYERASEHEILIAITLMEGEGDEAEMLAQPRLLIAGDQPARMLMANGEGLEYEIIIEPLT